MAKATLSPVQFHGSTIFVVTHKGEPYAPIKPIVEDMGLTWEAQARKLRDNRDRWGMINMIIPSASGNQDTLCMPVRKLPAFFASINPQQGTPRTPRPYPPLPRRMRRRPLELLDKGASNPEAEGRPARPGTTELARRRTAV